jgi:hypothetical protein
MSTMRHAVPARRWYRWATTGFSVVMALVFLVAGWVGIGPAAGIGMAAVMLVFAGGVELAARRSETVKGLLDRSDERITAMDLTATAFAGLVLIAVILVAFVVEIVRGQDGMPYAWLGAVAGVAYLLAILVQRLRG